ncbi:MULTISPECIES: chitinase [unclassified Streptomyces]|uniref:chitinase n=1 Tax=unclassified Streptomyces TaxID=2593676 RepID=UPI0013BE54BC|nr:MULTISPECIES: glycoside hydrolase family 18 protein [unclassified Streptomyces]MCX5279451.1 glycoside hydrolase family 18 protein [Streptomyces sp. NBC_00198]NEB29902.1 chitinase [Streptomyces sp. SID14446]WSD77253.1 glycoside hydrolase family 18 protein [Streptomyces sp. NBC_01558]WSK60852.1 glycoside hydrolase family 18 protein [Streptomyces sp. NBC_01281]
MERTRRSRPSEHRRRILAVCTAAVLAVPGLTALSSAARAADADLAKNGGFESGLANWTCTAASTVTTPVHSGSSALKATPAGSDYAQCSQTVTVKPDAQYTLSGFVRGSYVYLGASGTGTTDVSTWTQSAADWQQLSTTFRTGASTTKVTIYTHGWYGTGTYYADDLSLTGPGVDAGQPPAVPTGLKTGTVTSSSVGLSWTAVPGATGYAVYRDGTKIQTATGTSATVSGLTASTAYSFQVTATNDAGESAKSATVTATTSAGSGGGGGGSSDLPPHALVGYLHASFANGAGYTRMADVPDSWDVIDLAFGEPTSVTSGDIRFNRCPVTECPTVESDADFKAAIKAKQAAGKKVLISIGGQNGQVQLTTTAARDTFVSSVSKIIDTYGLDGLDIDFEGHSLSLDASDTNFKSPTTPVVVNLISALKTLKAKYGAKFVLSMAPETFFVQLGYQYYGTGKWGGQDPRAGAYLPVIYALRDDLTLLHVQDYNSGSIMGLDNQYHSMGGADFHIAMTDMLLTGFPVAGDANNVFPPLRPDQIAIGMPSTTNAGNGYVSPAEVTKTLDCLTKKTNCGTYTTHGTWPSLRGLMTWSINWDRFGGWEFSRNFDSYFG